MAKNRIGLQTIGLRGYLSTPAEIATAYRRIAEIGYGSIAGGGRTLSAEENKKLLDDAGLALAAMNVGLDRLENDMDGVIKDAKTLGTENIVIGAMPMFARKSLDGVMKLTEELNKYGAVLRDNGLYLSYHNHAIEFKRYEGKPALQHIMDNTDPEKVFFQLDTHWLQAGGGHVVSWIYRARGRVKVIHFKDYVIDEYSDTSFLECTHKLFCEVGQGSLNWFEIIQAAEDIGVEWFVVEQDTSRRPAFESAKMSFDFLKMMDLK